MSLERLIYSYLLKLDPEKAHNLGKLGIKYKFFAQGPYITENKPNLFCYEINNPLGLAAGFDKNGQISDQIIDYGFAWDEVGSISFYGSRGNEKPRLFRLEEGLLNRMGLNGDPAYKIIERLQNAKKPFAVNITKSPDDRIVGDAAVEDIRKTYSLIKNGLEPLNKLIYVALNLSCLNTRDGKTFEDPKNLKYLLESIREIKGKRPLLIKLSPSLEYGRLTKIVEISDDQIDGYICGNTLPFVHGNYGRGGLSGKLLRERTGKLIKTINIITTKTIIACGGITTGKDILLSQLDGADFFQVFTGFVCGNSNSGPSFAHKVLNEYYQLKRQLIKNEAVKNRQY